ncbi:MAG TPA: DUF2207 domain-containing protein [Sphingomicrobium sp.]|nr:DUF2207 domain-containing protein [Sphingomicrobium sp.]
MARLLAALAVLLSLAAVPSAASAEERITLFSSDIQVSADASLDVTETIDVRAEGAQINHGIFRDFPTRYRGPRGGQFRVGFKLGGVTRDGNPEPAAIEPIANGIRIRIGDADKLIEDGDHRYVIRYRTTRQIGRFADYDELYWNVTGNGWVFPIDVAEARIRLPAAVKLGQRSVYTGAQGSTARNADVVAEKPGDIRFRTTQGLAPYQGLTVAVAWPKGVVAEAAESERLRWWLADYGPPLVGVLALLGVAAFYYVAWKRAGRNPRPGTVVPLFSPTDNLTPAAMRYVWKMGADNRAFAAALVDLGVRGHVRMVEEDGGWLGRDKVRLERLLAATPLPTAEEAMLRELASSGESIVMEQKNHKKFSSAKRVLDRTFKNSFEGKLFKRNWGWALAGVVVFLAALWLTSAAVVAATGVLELTRVLVAVGAIVTTALLLMLMQEMEGAGKWVVALAAFAFAALAFGVGAPFIGAAFGSGWLVPLAIPLVAVPLVLSAFFWIAAPTKEGRAVLDRIAGFRQYLSITEGERLDRMTPPKETPELFERLLPYAIALGVENRWAERFQSVLAAAAVEGRQQFAWYAGSRSPWDNPGAFVGRVGSSLASTVSAAATAPGSRSGSGGGGFSGGGGGGGGGGGW